MPFFLKKKKKTQNFEKLSFIFSDMAYQLKKQDTTVMQRYIQGMEAAFESSLQCIVQLVYRKSRQKKRRKKKKQMFQRFGVFFSCVET